MDKFRDVLNWRIKHQTTLTYGALALLTAGGEQLFSVVVFSCPCNSWNALYGGVFLLVPALVLLLLGYLLNPRTWRLLTGCCHRRRPPEAPARRGWAGCLRLLLQLTGSALTAPATWVAVALLNGTFYKCLVTGLGEGLNAWALCQGKNDGCVQELPRLPCKKLPLAPVDADRLLLLQAQSQIIGWTLIACITILAVTFTCVSRCRSPVSFLQLKFWSIYMEKEKELFESFSKQHAGQLAERNVKCFFEGSIPKELQTPSNKEWQQISLLYNFNARKQCYSIIQKYVESKLHGQTSIRSNASDTLPPSAVNFVDDCGFAEAGL
ncbi:calcium homeostasis modulator protein 6 [Latimeria chalumnae]|uniref:Calcium homeostasis modulator family member 6 n=1 Tax=Latimeria chalumnae TaxID=7897 RepID=H2ZTP7_LATCH|nr:PREDICTED: protein FAM26F [Latimeria chalumnae]|eukprot:XP_014354423.1 PREDICTED: protein FAM26F [Latimeria chalumnae]